jgi:hypothetical protein
MTQPAVEPGFRSCEWKIDDAGTRCSSEAVCTVAFRIPNKDYPELDERQVKRTCREHLQHFIDYYWPRLDAHDAYIRIRLTREHIARKVLQPVARLAED